MGVAYEKKVDIPMLTMNYQGLKEKYSKPKKKKKPKHNKTFKNYWELLETNNSSSTKRKTVRGSGNTLKSNLTYQEQLKDERWKEKRLKILKKFNFKCCLCGCSENLNIHHLVYKKGKMAWEYCDSNYIVLCKDCHKKVHQDPSHKYYPKFK